VAAKFIAPLFTYRDGRLTQNVLTDASRYVMLRAMKEALSLAIDSAGGVSKLAVALGVSQNVVSNWKKRGKAPAARCPYIEAVTGVTCEMLRPDLQWLRNDEGAVTGYCVQIDS